MPPRTSVSTSQSAKRAMAHHGSMITILWVAVLFLTLGGMLALLQYMVRLDLVERQMALVIAQVSQIDQKMANYQVQEMEAAAEATGTQGVLPTASPIASPTQLLNRGAYSPDGNKYAGYDDTTKGKIGVGVQTVSDQRVRHVVLFNTKTESSGVGTVAATGMSVRWLDNQTIEYDVISTKANGQQVKETRSVKIFF